MNERPMAGGNLQFDGRFEPSNHSAAESIAKSGNSYGCRVVHLSSPAIMMIDQSTFQRLVPGKVIL